MAPSGDGPGDVYQIAVRHHSDGAEREAQSASLVSMVFVFIHGSSRMRFLPVSSSISLGDLGFNFRHAELFLVGQLR